MVFSELSTLQQSHEVDTIVLPHLQMTELRRRDVNNLPRMTLLVNGVA